MFLCVFCEIFKVLVRLCQIHPLVVWWQPLVFDGNYDVRKRLCIFLIWIMSPCIQICILYANDSVGHDIKASFPGRWEMSRIAIFILQLWRWGNFPTGYLTCCHTSYTGITMVRHTKEASVTLVDKFWWTTIVIKEKMITVTYRIVH